jgi:hypothetical protein
LKGLFNQRKTWGHGEVLLYKKYKVHYHNPEKNFAKEMCRDYTEFFRLVLGTLPAMLHNKLISKNEVAFQAKKLAMIGAWAGGWEVGGPSGKRSFIYRMIPRVTTALSFSAIRSSP